MSHDSSCRVCVLAICPSKTDHTALAHIFGHTAWEFDSASNLTEATLKLTNSSASVLLCEERLPDGTWKDLLAHTRTMPSPPVVIVVSRRADDELWAEALKLNAYDVLAKPFQQREVINTIGLAWRYWDAGRKSMAIAYPDTAVGKSEAVA